MNTREQERGFALAALLCFLTAAVVLTATMVPLYQMQARREREKELLFRGEEYVRAIQKYQRKYQQFPASIDDLLSRDGLRFLRHQYKDPITGEDFRLISVNADGTLTNSLTMLTIPIPQNTGNQVPGGTGPTGTGGAGGGATGGNNPSNPALGTAPSFLGVSTGIGGNPLAGGGQAGQNRPSGQGGGAGVGTVSGGGVGTIGGGGVGAGAGGGAGGGAFGGPVPINQQSVGGRPTTNSQGTPGNPFSAGGTAGAGTNPTGLLTGGGTPQPQITPGIAGVASESVKESVMIYNTHEKYNEWEFVAPYVAPPTGGGAGGGGGAAGGAGGGAGAFGGGATGAFGAGGGGGRTGPGGGNGVGPTGNPVNPGAGGGFGPGNNPFGTAPLVPGGAGPQSGGAQGGAPQGGAAPRR